MLDAARLHADRVAPLPERDPFATALLVAVAAGMTFGLYRLLRQNGLSSDMAGMLCCFTAALVAYWDCRMRWRSHSREREAELARLAGWDRAQD